VLFVGSRCGSRGLQFVLHRRARASPAALAARTARTCCHHILRAARWLPDTHCITPLIYWFARDTSVTSSMLARLPRLDATCWRGAARLRELVVLISWHRFVCNALLFVFWHRHSSEQVHSPFALLFFPLPDRFAAADGGCIWYICGRSDRLPVTLCLYIFRLVGFYGTSSAKCSTFSCITWQAINIFSPFITNSNMLCNAYGADNAWRCCLDISQR